MSHVLLTIWWRNAQCMLPHLEPVQWWSSYAVATPAFVDASCRCVVGDGRRVRWSAADGSIECCLATASLRHRRLRADRRYSANIMYHWLEPWSHKKFRTMLTTYEIRNNVDCDGKKKHFHTVFLSALLFLGSLGFELSSNFWNRHREHLQCLTTTCISTVKIHTVFAYITFEALQYLPQYLSVFCPWDCVWSCSVHWFHQSVPLQTQIRFVLRFSTWVK